MDFSLPEAVERKRQQIRRFALKEFTESKKRYYDENEKFPFEIMHTALDNKLIDFSNPWEFMVAIEELFRVDPGLGNSIISYAFGSEILKLYGNEDQKARYLDPVLRGEKIMALGVTESVAGSDVAGIASRIEREPGGDWLLNGSKMFITNGTVADVYLVLAKNEPLESRDQPHRSMTLCIVESGWEGFSRTKLTGKLGVRATDTAELVFSNVRVPERNIIGEPGKGFYYVMKFFDISRVYISAQSVGIAQGALDAIVERSRADPEFASREGIQFTISEIATRIDAARLLTYRAASLLFDLNPDPVFTSMAKYYAAETATYATETAMKVLGMNGAVTSLERLFRDAKIMEIWEGSSEIEKLIIFRMFMKKEVENNGRGV
ncbi:MAG: acyl-CoA dehydrogenase family protein [Nitrososphaeria archaeon]